MQRVWAWPRMLRLSYENMRRDWWEERKGGRKRAGTRERERERCKKNVIGDQQKQTNKMAYFYPLTLDVWVQMIPYGREGDTGSCDLKGEGDSFTAITHPPARLSPSASWPHKMTYYIPDLFVLLKFNIKQIFAWYCEKKKEKLKFVTGLLKMFFLCTKWSKTLTKGKRLRR